MNKTRTCPVCKGAGNTKPPAKEKKQRVADNAVMAKMLHREGYSLREIQRFLGYKSSRSAQLLIERRIPDVEPTFCHLDEATMWIHENRPHLKHMGEEIAHDFAEFSKHVQRVYFDTDQRRINEVAAPILSKSEGS